ncbi:hypothetical protein [Halomonas denitrificans]|nr:hypothetical protein [Halomonas denitrificans]
MSRKRPPRNPAGRPLAAIAFTTLGLLGIAAAFGLDAVLDWTASPLLILCALALIVYTAFALHSGWIATVGYRGQIDHFERSREPVIYWMLVLLYLGLAGPTAAYLFAGLLTGGPA